MKVVITQEHYDKAMEAIAAYKESPNNYYTKSCLVAQALQGAGLESPIVGYTHAFVRPSPGNVFGKRFSLPKEAADLVTWFDKKQRNEIDTEMKFPVEFEIEIEIEDT